MSEKDWEVGAMLKNKPGSQGTLLRGGTKYSRPTRYPRGYTPERQAEVRSNIEMSPLGVRENPTGARATRARLTDTIARSTAPVEHLQGVQFSHVEPGQRLTSPPQGPTKSGDNDAGGIYMTPRGNRDAGLIAVKPHLDRTSTTLHELGHHVSHMVEQNNHAYDEAGHSGAEEARADNYAETHFRDRKGRAKEQGTYGGGRYAGHIDRSDEFWNSYHQNRSSEMYKAHVETENAKYYKKYPEEEPHPDGSYDEPLISKPYTSEGETPTMHINDEALPPGKTWWDLRD